ncbi:MAG: porin [Prosthecobacter sp.]
MVPLARTLFSPRKLHLALLLAGLALCSLASAQQAVTGSLANAARAPAAVRPTSIFDQIWGSPVLYKAESGFLTNFAFQGLLHLQDDQGWSDRGDFGTRDRPESVRWSDFEVRRMRLGFKSKLMDGKGRLDGLIDVNANFNQFYGRMNILFFEYAFSDALTVGFGKRKAYFSLEHTISSREILTVERALLTNALFTSRYTGIWASGKAGKFQWDVAGYAGDDEREFTTFHGGALIQAGLGYDLKEATGLDRASINFDYQKATADTSVKGNTFEGAPVPYLFESAMSLNSSWEKGPRGFYTDILHGHGRGSQGDVSGIILMPAFYATKNLQFVGRYQYALGENDGLRLASRYDRLATGITDSGHGGEYHGFYLGANYYIYGHKLKLMTGLEFVTLSGGGHGGSYNGWSWSSALRMYF